MNLKVPSIAEEIGKKANADVNVDFMGYIRVEFKNCLLAPVFSLRIRDQNLVDHAFFPEPLVADLADRIAAVRKAWEGGE